jgi:oligopeptide transport system substrate-binding protein
MEPGDFFKHFQGAQLFIVGWWSNYPSPGNYLRVGLQALAGDWRHQGYDELIQEAMRIRDESERLRLYQQADRILMEEAAVVPLFYRADHYLVKPWVTMPLQNFSLKDAVLEPH